MTQFQTVGFPLREEINLPGMISALNWITAFCECEFDSEVPHIHPFCKSKCELFTQIMQCDSVPQGLTGTELNIKKKNPSILNHIKSLYYGYLEYDS